jgi:SAM-dependent methyltransferase
MLESKNPEIDVEHLLKRVGAELTLQKNKIRQHGTDSLDQFPLNDPYAWNQMQETLKTAGHNVNAGADAISALHYRGIKRRIIQVIGKATNFFGRVITIPQRKFNNAILHSQHILLDGIREMNKRSAQLERQTHKNTLLIDYLKTGLITQERRVTILLEELRRQLKTEDKSECGAKVGKEVPDILDPMYIAFENQFRGTREEIRDRLIFYLPRVRAAGAGVEKSPVLDLGCGRGEWLEILGDAGFIAVGVDLNHALVNECLERGLQVIENDALEYLRSLPDNSLGAITGFHLIEHMDFDTRIALFDESIRVLQPGGFALFETPNPKNLLVGSCNFWSDPTHIRPLYPETHQFLMEYRGFCKVELLFLHPHEEDQRLPEDEAPRLAARLNELYSCARDYSIVGYKV